LVFNGWMLMLNRAFFSLQENWLPTIVALANLALNAALDAAFYRFGTWGIPLATTVVNVAGAAFLLALLRRRLGRIDLSRTAPALAKIVAASALAALAFFVWLPLDRALGRLDPTDHYLIVVDGRPVGVIQTYLAADHLDWEQIVQVGGVCPGRSADRRGRADRPRARAPDPRKPSWTKSSSRDGGLREGG